MAAIDLVTVDPASGEVALIMSEFGPWNSEERLRAIQDRVHDYLEFALDGELERRFPDAIRKPVRIQIDCDYDLDPRAQGFLELIAEYCLDQGVRLVANRLRLGNSS